MYTRFFLGFFAAFLVTAGFFEVQHSDRAQRIERRLRVEREVEDERVVRLFIDNKSCTGFVVAKNVLATAAHCISQPAPIKEAIAEFTDGSEKPFKVIAQGGTAAGQDWALLKTDTGKRPPFQFAITPPTLGEMVASVGHPYGVPEQLMTYGMIMRLDNMIHTAQTNYPGESGSPLIDRGGQVMGIVAAINVQAPVTYVTPIGVLARKLFQLGHIQ